MFCISNWQLHISFILTLGRERHLVGSLTSYLESVEEKVAQVKM